MLYLKYYRKCNKEYKCLLNEITGIHVAVENEIVRKNRDLIKKCFSSLNKNGKIVILDWIMNNDRTQPTSGAIFAINMLVGTEAGDCFTELEVTEMLNAAGFKNISRIEFESGLSQMTAQKL